MQNQPFTLLSLGGNRMEIKDFFKEQSFHLEEIEIHISFVSFPS